LVAAGLLGAALRRGSHRVPAHPRSGEGRDGAPGDPRRDPREPARRAQIDDAPTRKSGAVGGVGERQPALPRGVWGGSAERTRSAEPQLEERIWYGCRRAMARRVAFAIVAIATLLLAPRAWAGPLKTWGGEEQPAPPAPPRAPGPIEPPEPPPS